MKWSRNKVRERWNYTWMKLCHNGIKLKPRERRERDGGNRKIMCGNPFCLSCYCSRELYSFKLIPSSCLWEVCERFWNEQNNPLLWNSTKCCLKHVFLNSNTLMAWLTACRVLFSIVNKKLVLLQIVFSCILIYKTLQKTQVISLRNKFSTSVCSWDESIFSWLFMP